MNPLLLNRDFALPADDFIHLVPLGEFPHPSGVVQVIDRRAAQSMVNRFVLDSRSPNFPGVLVDYDHFSDAPDKPSEAAAWIQELQLREDGIWGKPRWTTPGKQAVLDGTYRLVSPVFNAQDAELENAAAAAKRLRPMRLIKVALTNDPNLKGMVPLSNREGARAPAADQTKTTDKTKMKSIATKLGLSAEASEDAISAEVEKLLNRAKSAEAELAPLRTERDELKNRNTELEGEQVETELAGRSLPAEKVAKLRPVLLPMKNRADRVAFLDEVIGKQGATASIGTKPNVFHNRQAAGTPTVDHTGAEVNGQAQAAKAEAEVQSYKLANRCTYDQAYNQVRAQKPELFGITTTR
jgi:phage I-like protein